MTKENIREYIKKNAEEPFKNYLKENLRINIKKTRPMYDCPGYIEVQLVLDGEIISEACVDE